MRIGFFSPTINRIGGGEWVTVNMINSLKAKGHEIVVYSEEKVDSNRIFQVFGRRLCLDEETHFWPYIFDPYNPKSVYENTLRSLIFKSKCDLLIDTFSNGLLPWSDAVYFQGNAFVSLIPKGYKGLFFWPFKTLLRQFRKSSSYKNKIAMACSQFSAKMIEEAINHKIEVLYPPISDFFKTNEVRENLRGNTVITLSRFAKEKRLEMVPRIAKLTPNSFSFVIVGACRCSDDILSVQNHIRELGVEKKVKLMPNISRTKLKDIMHRSKVCLHTGANEPFGISIIEAMSSGCIPVVPDSGGPKEFVPKQLRYESVEEAASLTESSVFNWSTHKAEEFVKASNRFSEERFSNEFLKIMNL
jgi:glycosyltransferase involved in cell wall biosynthesis